LRNCLPAKALKTTPPKINKTKLLNVELDKASTPIAPALIGRAIGMAMLIVETDPAEFGLISTAIAGAVGLARPYKEQDLLE
jgi:hypothetical protein